MATRRYLRRSGLSSIVDSTLTIRCLNKTMLIEKHFTSIVFVMVLPILNKVDQSGDFNSGCSPMKSSCCPPTIVPDKH